MIYYILYFLAFLLLVEHLFNYIRREKIKMKKILLFITILAIGLYYINQKTHWITNRTYEISDVRTSSTILLHKRETQEHVHGFFVGITGYIEGKEKLTLDYQNSSKNPHRIENISGNVDIKWGGDWYADVLKIEYEPIADVKGGSLSLEYNFDGF